MRHAIPGLLVPVFLTLLAATDAKAAPADAMEAQRCIWRCGDATGLRQPAYDRCIARQCDTGQTKRRRRR
ncbi:hypothetical protein [Methylobacterium sp. 17Sr1-1]|uniref:hypothetical protein n=1 Tax=Methylobacterium sp. 17Sr1-1 TaxID=2202826 RepID=UPI000D6FCD52|nr:hypothetical protein [Methylobacterium sp. 17Sr1-1]AWN50688.1 hypothetical protein DK412_02210 [Methylobacterium sp. 17Sr1-1]